jgi:hypothetical protein
MSGQVRYQLVDIDGERDTQDLPMAPELVPAKVVGILLHPTSAHQPDLTIVVEVQL